MNQSRPHPLLISVLINLVLFSLVLAFSFPIFNSGDDVYLLYLSGGGFGEAPTELLHYHYGMHPYIGLLLKNLFILRPGFNWYTAMLYLFHFVACVVLLMQLLKKNKLAAAIISYVLIFIAIEARLLLQPSFTNTAFVTAMAGVLLLYDALRSQTHTTIKLILGYVFILAGAMLRLHLLIPVALIAIPFFIINVKKRDVRFVAFHAVSISVLITVFILLQQQYYKQHIPGWEAEEAYRQAVIHHYNIPKAIGNLPDSIKIAADMLEQGILWDKTFLSNEKIAATTAAVQVTRSFGQAGFNGLLYWLLIESRVGLLLMLLLFCWRYPLFSKQERVAVISSAILLFTLCIALLLFRKLPVYVVPCCLLQWLAFTSITGSDQKTNSSKRNLIFAALGILLFVLAAIRLNKLNNWNRQQHTRFTCGYKLVAASPGKLFIVTDDKFPMAHFSVWSTPHQYPLPNLLYKDHFLNNSYQHSFKKFGIKDPLQFIDNEKIIFTGIASEIVRRYYEFKTAGKTVVIEDTANNNCIPTWRLSTSLPQQ